MLRKEQVRLVLPQVPWLLILTVNSGAVEAVPPQPPVSDSSRLLDLEKLQRVLQYAVLDDFTHLLCTIYRGCRYNAGMGLKQLSQFLVEHDQLDAIKHYWPETLLPEQPTGKVAHEPVVEANLANEEEPAIDGEPAEEEHPAVGNKPRTGNKRKRDFPRDCKKGKKQRVQLSAANAVDTSKPKRVTLQDRVRALEDRNEQMSFSETSWEKEREALLEEIQVLKKDNKAKVKSLRAIKIEQEDQQQLVEKIKSLGSEKRDLRAENKKLKKRLLETGCDMKKVFQKLTLVED